MRNLTGALALMAVVGGAGVAPAQSWQSEFGIQGGYARVKPAGTSASDHVDVFDVPGFSFPGLFPSYGSLYAIFPWKNTIAIEGSVAASQSDIASTLDLGLRADFALSPKFYAAAGGALAWFESGGLHESQLALQAAVGYRFGFVAGLRGRVEGSARFFGKSDNVPPLNVYALTLGVSTPVGAARGGGTPAPRRGPGAWQPVFGVAGGYARAHVLGVGDLAGISVPGFGGGLTTSLGPLIGVPIAAPPTLFVVLPIGEKLAVEPGLDLHRIQGGGTTIFAGNLSTRLNYAVSGGWYAAAGLNVQYLKATGSDAELVTGANAAWGYRFVLTPGLGGRFEATYIMMARNSDVPVPPINTLGLMFAATMPLR